MEALGEFGVERGVSSRIAAAAYATAVGAVALAAVRPAGADEARWASSWAILLGTLAVGLGIAGMYVSATRGIHGRALGKVGVGLGVAVVLYAVLDTAVRDGTFTPGAFARAYLDWDIMRQLSGDFRRGLANTLKYSVLAQVFAVGVGLIIATFALSAHRRFRWPAVVYVDVVRGLPIVVLTLLINFGLPYVGVRLDFLESVVIVLTINASAYIAEIFRAGIQSLPRGQMDAARSLGMPRETAMATVIVPQAVRAVIPPLVSEFIALLKDSAIVVALVGYTIERRDLFGAASQTAASTFSPTPYLLAALVYLAVTVPTARLVGRLERRLRAKVA